MAQCLFPRVTSVKSAFYQTCMEQGSKKFWRDEFHAITPYSRNLTVFRCGKCVNCLKRSTSNFVVRVQSEAQKRPLLSFLTLTYREDLLPISMSEWLIDKTTGEYILFHTPELVATGRDPDCKRVDSDTGDVFEHPEVRAEVLKLVRGRCPRYYERVLFENFLGNEDFELRARWTPSVCREDARLWLKAGRVAFEREFGYKLPEFKYVLVPEFSFKRCRPHYHVLFMGLKHFEVAYLAKRWSYGYTYQQDVPIRNLDGSDAVAKVSRYLSKYISKGSFECESVKDRCVEKPRVCQSKGIGRSIIDKVRDYVCCFDMFGKYDLDSLQREDSSVLTEEQVNRIVREIPKRLHYSPDGKFNYPLPRYVVDAIFKVTYKIKKNEENRSLVRPYKIWSLVTDYLRSLNVDLYQRKFEQFCSEHPLGTLSENLTAFKFYLQSSAELEDEAGKKTLLAFYNKSKH